MSDAPRRLYLAGPMSGYAEHNFPEFNRVAALLRAEGYEVFNPAENDDGGVRRPRSFYMRRDIPALMDCDAIAALPNWQQSRGACLEMWIAIDLDMPIFNCRMRDGSVSLEPNKAIDIKALPFSRVPDADRRERQPTDQRATGTADKTQGAAGGMESRLVGSLREPADRLPAAGRSLL
ncbi:MAG: DUF4406 domain-containing protein [Planctomycetes bacterium]|nr:DUF4406 domain-containing protein [Planctomycetota bacterium]